MAYISCKSDIVPLLYALAINEHLRPRTRARFFRFYMLNNVIIQRAYNSYFLMGIVWRGGIYSFSESLIHRLF